MAAMSLARVLALAGAELDMFVQTSSRASVGAAKQFHLTRAGFRYRVS